MYHMYSREPHLVVAVKLFQQTLISSFGEPTLLIQQVQDTQFLGGRMKKFKGLRQRGTERHKERGREEGKQGGRKKQIRDRKRWGEKGKEGNKGDRKWEGGRRIAVPTIPVQSFT